MSLNLVNIEVRDLGDAWFQAVDKILSEGYEYVIDHGSNKGQKRLEFDHITIHIKFPGVRPLIPDIPKEYGIPNPVEEGYIERYLPYLMTPKKEPNEDYTYGERLSGWRSITSTVVPNVFKQYENAIAPPYAIPVHLKTINQIQGVVDMYTTKGYGTNQATMAVAIPSDIHLGDPPCLRVIDTRVRYGKLHFIVYFRSWDLWNGFPANLGALQLLKEYMAGEIGIEDGEIIASSKGLHLYDYVWELAEMRTRKIRQA